MDPDVFICHSSADAQQARDICDRLEVAGVKCWIAPRDPVPGIPYGQQLVNAIAAAQIVLLVFSANANDSQGVLSELELASNRKKIILPVYIEDVAPSARLEFYVRAIQWFDAVTRPPEQVWGELLRDVQSLLDRAAPVAAKAEAQEIGAVRPPQHNLPSSLTSFVGRDVEVIELGGLLDTSRLVTLCGPGGIGKTSLALRVAVRRLGGYGDGAWFVDLAQTVEGALVAKSVAMVFDIQESAKGSIADLLVAYLRNKRLLIILDNCEQVVTEAAGLTERILQACPQVTILATSREALDVPGERIYRVPSLAVPPPEAIRNLTAAAALKFDAIALFVDRAKAVDSRFTLDDSNAAVVAKICSRLDGIALAIELAAARAKLLSVSALAASLDRRFDIFTDGARTALPRHKTLRAMIDWSYDLLSEHERVLFRRLAVFVGGFTLELATEVCANGVVADADVLDLLGSLVDKSLVQADVVKDEARYHLLESMRAYAREKLVDQGELESTTYAHAVAYLHVAERLEAIWETTPDRAWKLKAEPEMENWRAALRGAFAAGGDAVLGEQLAAALLPAWFTMTPSEGRRWIRAGLESIDGTTPTRVLARLTLADAHLAMLDMQYQSALPAAERALKLFRQIDDRQGAALANMFAGAARALQGDVDAGTACLQEALSESRRLGMRRATAGALIYLGALKLRSGDVSAARVFYAEALELLEAVGAERGIATHALNLAELEYQAGDPAKAVRFANHALKADGALNDLDAVTFDLCNLAAYFVALRRWDEARTHAREALSLALDRQITSATMWALQHLAAISALRPNKRIAAALDDRRRAARLIGFVDSSLVEFKIGRDFTERVEYERTLAAIGDELGDDVVRLRGEGRLWSEARAAKEAACI